MACCRSPNVRPEGQIAGSLDNLDVSRPSHGPARYESHALLDPWIGAVAAGVGLGGLDPDVEILGEPRPRMKGHGVAATTRNRTSWADNAANRSLKSLFVIRFAALDGDGVQGHAPQHSDALLARFGHPGSE